eukprot:32231-Ditylum_brightwellii.AAC.1
MYLEQHTPGVVCSTTATNTRACSEFHILSRAPQNSAVRMEMNLLPIRPLGTLYWLVSRPAKHFHLRCHTQSSSTPPV